MQVLDDDVIVPPTLQSLSKALSEVGVPVPVKYMDYSDLLRQHRYTGMYLQRPKRIIKPVVRTKFRGGSNNLPLE